MTKEAKHLWIAIGAVVILIILLIARRSGSAITNVTNNTSPVSVEVPAFNLPLRAPIILDLPQTPGMPPFDFSMVSACACGGSSVPAYTRGPDENFNYNLTTYQVSNFTQTNPIQQPALAYHGDWGQGFTYGGGWGQGRNPI